MEESTLFFEMQLRNVVVYQKTKYTQILKLYFFQTHRRKSYSVMSCNRGYTISKYQKYIQYDLKSINFNLNYFDIQISDRKLLNKIYWRNFIQNF